MALPSLVIRDADPMDFDAICALNLADIHHTSAMDSIQLSALHAWSSYHRVACVGDVVCAFLLALRDGAPYQNDNYAWFCGRYPHFIYVDRIVVSSGHRGLRLASLLYEDLFGYARSKSIPLVTCEYNLVPPNEPSRWLHDKFGFKEQGTHWLDNGRKRVSLQVAETARGKT